MDLHDFENSGNLWNTLETSSQASKLNYDPVSDRQRWSGEPLA